MRAILPLMVFSLFLAGCGIDRPDTNVCIVNAPALNRKCYNLKTDYENDGTLKKGAIPQYRPNATIGDLNKALIIDPVAPPANAGLANFKAWIQKIRDKAGETVSVTATDILGEDLSKTIEGSDVSTATLQPR